ncbi:hypothetical protein IV203_025116 [Nitzschia inconspicua]|uniref:DUF6824 domain-containing protein n=1 Tax=Nitzschia inconspicua TaxID=303405 RepID=A0A9K3K9R5_9STRA|nr:hypothetical protein IV203_002609 [Nitzschia inconspicua]KAG7339547.1 hypothetical protein IV203_025140 [Nitzschia inconspicua]KAG7359350.1 hypothetical protein IV203_034448 [Nitzschia inconspicua]KAG7365675.1 hypothetical protein IV203_025116 [Nitzschia inconspicua]
MDPFSPSTSDSDPCHYGSNELQSQVQQQQQQQQQYPDTYQPSAEVFSSSQSNCSSEQHPLSISHAATAGRNAVANDGPMYPPPPDNGPTYVVVDRLMQNISTDLHESIADTHQDIFDDNDNDDHHDGHHQNNDDDDDNDQHPNNIQSHIAMQQHQQHQQALQQQMQHLIMQQQQQQQQQRQQQVIFGNFTDIQEHRSFHGSCDSSSVNSGNYSSAASTGSATSCGIGSGSAYSGTWGDDDNWDDWAGIPDVDTAPTPPPPHLADSIIAQQMSKMSVQEREQVYCDLHGVREELNETPVLVFQSMERMKDHLQKLVSQGRASAYHQAVQQNAHYCHKPDNLTKFLRAESMDPIQAALRMARHYDSKRELFGVDKLAKDITQDDLEDSPEDLQTLYGGQSQIVCKRDRAGRAIFLCHGGTSGNCSVLSKLRRQFYLAQMMAEDEETQRKGMIIVYVANHSRVQLDTTYAWKAAGAARSQPIRVEAFHFCLDSAKSGWKTVFDTFKMAMHPFLKVRVKTHCGTFEECMQSLQTYGIPTKEFPLRMVTGVVTGPNGTLQQQKQKQQPVVELVVDIDYHVEMMMKRRERENRYKNLIRMTFPQQQQHPSNPPESISVSSDPTGGSQWLQQQLLQQQKHHTQQQQHQQQQLSQQFLPDSMTSNLPTQEITDMVVPASVSFVPLGSGMFSSMDSVGEVPPPPNTTLSHLTSHSLSIPSPVASGSNNRKDMKKKKPKHNAHSALTSVCVPSRNDVLFGRGKRFQNHVGNQRFRTLIEDCLPSYDKASKEQKTKIAQEIVGIVHQARGRFLKDDGAGWAQVTDIHLLRQKVAHAFRGLRSQKQMHASQAAKAAVRHQQQQQEEEGTMADLEIDSGDGTSSRNVPHLKPPPTPDPSRSS